MLTHRFLNEFAKIRPAFEKRRSLETDVAGIEWKILANFAMSGNCGEFSFHQLKMLQS